MTARFVADFAEVGYTLGLVEGVSGTVKTRDYVSSVIQHSHRRLARSFNNYMHLMAQGNKAAYHHVYEWNQTGTPGMQLWRNRLEGRGANRNATFEFRPSVTPVPKPNLPPSSTGRQVSGKRHFFPAKPWVMEYGIPVRVSGTPLILDMTGRYIQRSGEKDRGYIFAEDVFIERPGGDVVGNFTRQFVFWWTNVAQREWESTIRPQYEKDIEGAASRTGRRSGGRAGARASRRGFSIAVNAGREAARREMMIDAARYRSTDYDETLERGFN